MDEARREQTLALARRLGARLGWREVAVLWLGLGVMLIFGLVVVTNVSEGETVSAVSVALYAAGAAVAAGAMSRFRPATSVRRFVVLVALGAVFGALLLLDDLLGRALGGLGFALGWAAILGALGLVLWALRENATFVPTPEAPNLAAALVGREDAERILGEEVSEPSTQGSWLFRSQAMCSYLGQGGRRLMVVVAGAPPVARLRGAPDSQPAEGIGDAGVWHRGGLAVISRGWLLTLSLPGASDSERRSELAQVAQQAVQRLPARDELGRDVSDRERLATGVGVAHRGLSAILGRRGRRPDSP